MIIHEMGLWHWWFSVKSLSAECHRMTKQHWSWWCYQMETFSALLALCAENSLVTGEFPSQRPVTRSFDVFFDLHLNKQLSKQMWGWWFETPSHSLWCHCNDNIGSDNGSVPCGEPTNFLEQWWLSSMMPYGIASWYYIQIIWSIPWWNEIM